MPYQRVCVRDASFTSLETVWFHWGTEGYWGAWCVYLVAVALVWEQVGSDCGSPWCPHSLLLITLYMCFSFCTADSSHIAQYLATKPQSISHGQKMTAKILITTNSFTYAWKTVVSSSQRRSPSSKGQTLGQVSCACKLGPPEQMVNWGLWIIRSRRTV